MIRLFTGYDKREAIGLSVFIHSVLKHASQPVAITPITPQVALSVMGTISGGTNAFTRARFLVPHLCGYKGWAIFADGVDMLCKADIAQLWAWKDATAGDIRKELWCVKHDYSTQFPRKYEGTDMEAENKDYDRKNWASLMLINCASAFARLWSPEILAVTPIMRLLQMDAFHDDRVGDLPMEWNWLADEYGPNARAKLLHWTAGIPAFRKYRCAAHASEWTQALAETQEGYQPDRDLLAKMT